MYKSKKIVKILALILACSLLLIGCSDKINGSNLEDIKAKSYLEIGGLELPINGATGFASVAMELKEYSDINSKTISTLEPGSAFEIIEEELDWWFVRTENNIGWVQHKYCLVNLPDIIPSIIYDNTNTYNSKFKTSGKNLPGISEQALYSADEYNARLGKDEYITPVLYSMARKICIAQQNALRDGNSLKIYEGFRPYEIQQDVFEAMTKLSNNDTTVMEGINSYPWNIKWFISEGVSNHQKGYAIDVSLVKIDSQNENIIDEYKYVGITNYTEYTMPTEIHELSTKAVRFEYPVSGTSKTAWESSTLASSMNEAAIKLQNYCISGGLTPLASEWWHFNDLDAMDETIDNPSDGKYYLNESYRSIQ